MDHVELEAQLNGSPGCRCHDAAAKMRAEVEGKPGPEANCPLHSDAGRTAALERARTDAYLAVVAEAGARTEQAIALNSPRLTDSVRAVLEAGPTTPTA